MDVKLYMEACVIYSESDAEVLLIIVIRTVKRFI